MWTKTEQNIMNTDDYDEKTVGKEKRLKIKD